MAFPNVYGMMQAPTLGELGNIPGLNPTEEDKKRAWQQALMALSAGLVKRDLSQGLLGASQAYGQAMNAPAQRLEAWGKLQDMYGKQLDNAKKFNDVQQNNALSGLLAGAANTTASPFYVQGGQEIGIGPLSPDTPEMKAATTKARADKYNDPAFISNLLAYGMKGSDLKAAQEATRPQQINPGTYLRGPDGSVNYLPNPEKGIGFGEQGVYALPGAASAQNALSYANKSGDLSAQLAYDRAKLPYDIQRAGGVAAAEKAATDPYGFQTFTGPNGEPIYATNPQARAAMGGGNQFPNARVTPEQQAQRDAVRRQILASEGQDPNTPTRLNDSGPGKLAPQLFGLRGQSPAQGAQDKALAERYATMYGALQTNADSERAKYQAYSQINNLLKGYEGGTLADMALSIASEANRLGINIDAKLSNKEAANAIRNQLIGEFKNMLPGPMSDADRRFLMAIPPSILNSARGRELMAEIQGRKSMRSQAESEMAAAYLEKHGKIDVSFERQLNKWRRENSIFQGMSYGQ